MPTPGNPCSTPHGNDVEGLIYGAFLRASVAGKMGPRFRGDDKIGVSDFPRTALRERGDDKSRSLQG
jgi:hypothetical protein